MLDLEREYRMACYRARFWSWRLGRRVARPNWAVDHWLHMPLRYEDTGEPI